MNLDLRIPGGGAAPMIVSGASRPYMFCNGSMVAVEGIGGAGLLAPNGANVLTLLPMIVCVPITITRWTFTVGTTAASTVNFGIYDANGNKLFDSGAISTAAAVTLSGIGNTVTIQPGFYWFAMASPSTTATSGSTISPIASGASNTIMNFTVVRIGVKAANALAAGVLPATLGALSAGTLVAPYGIFE